MWGRENFLSKSLLFPTPHLFQKILKFGGVRVNLSLFGKFFAKPMFSKNTRIADCLQPAKVFIQKSLPPEARLLTRSY